MATTMGNPSHSSSLRSIRIFSRSQLEFAFHLETTTSSSFPVMHKRREEKPFPHFRHFHWKSFAQISIFLILVLFSHHFQHFVYEKKYAIFILCWSRFFFALPFSSLQFFVSFGCSSCLLVRLQSFFDLTNVVRLEHFISEHFQQNERVSMDLICKFYGKRFLPVVAKRWRVRCCRQRLHQNCSFELTNAWFVFIYFEMFFSFFTFAGIPRTWYHEHRWIIPLSEDWRMVSSRCAECSQMQRCSTLDQAIPMSW